MEDQGKRLMLAAGLVFALMLVWNALFPQPEAPPKIAEVAESAVGETPAVPVPTPGAVPEVAEAEPELPRGPEQFFAFDFENVRMKFSSYGASLVSYRLKHDRMIDLETHEPEDLIRVKHPDFRFLQLSFPNSTYQIPKGAEWRGEKISDTEIRFVWESADIRVEKTLVFVPEDFMILMNVKLDLVGATTAKQSMAVSLYGQEDPNIEEGGMFERVSREWMAACYFDEEINTTKTKSLADDGPLKKTGRISWGGFDHAYFLAVGAFKGTKRSDCNKYPLAGIEGGMGVDLVTGDLDMKRGELGFRSEMSFYLGPKYRDTLRAADRNGVQQGFIESVDLGNLAIIAGPLLGLLNFFQGFVVNWGIAILLLTLVVKGLTLPWTHKSMKSMKAMARLKPQLDKIKEKYKDDRTRQNVETMNLFKTHKVNPMSGCLPMILQMPIWFALYRALTVAAELYQAPFIDGWIDDLTLPDPYHVMPILLTGMMFLQTRLTPTQGTGTQQKVMMYGMPIMFGGFAFFFPAGLTLYIFINTLFTALHHLYMHKTDPNPVVETAAAVASTADVIDVDSSEKSDESNPAKAISKKRKSGKKKKKRS